SVFFFQAEDGIRDRNVTGVQTCALPISAFAVVGTSIGFKLYLGPIVWGLMAGLIGFTLGLAIRLIIELVFKKRKKRLRGSHSETILIIDCKEEQVELIESILWEH